MATRTDERMILGANSRHIGIILFLGVAILVAISVIALPAFNPQSSAALPVSSEISVDAETARWIAMGKFYAAQAEARQLAQEAEAARWNAMGEFYAAQAEAP